MKASAVLSALHIREPRAQQLLALNGQERREALDFCDKQGITLFLRNFLPEETAAAVEKNQQRLRLLQDTSRRLTELPYEFVTLKGTTQCELFGVRPEDRPQYDVDLFLPQPSTEQARDVLLTWNYESIPGMDDFPTDHLPGLFPRTTWRWRDDYFDPEMPLAIELHFRLWNAQLERIDAPGVDEFWGRRVQREVGGVPLTVLCPQDAAAYAALHLLKHLLQGSVRCLHVYELARFLHTRATDEVFWSEWQNLHPPQLRRLQTVAFLLAQSWFGCEMPSAVQEEAQRLPKSVRTWFAEFATSPMVQPFHPNKDELWLHLSLLRSWGDRFRVARRRLFPANLPPPSRASETQSRHRVYAAWLASRFRHHAISLFKTGASGIRFWKRLRR